MEQVLVSSDLDNESRYWALFFNKKTVYPILKYLNRTGQEDLASSGSCCVFLNYGFPGSISKLLIFLSSSYFH